MLEIISLLKDIIMNIFINIYSYNIYIIIGILLFFIISMLTQKINIDVNFTKALLLIMSLFLPICSCISITFLLYKKVIEDEKYILIMYILSTYFNITAFLYIFLYYGKMVLYLYLFILIMVFMLLNIFLNNIDTKDNELSKFNKKNYSLNNNLYHISHFIFIHFIAIVIMSIINVLFKNTQYIDLIETNKNIPIFLFNNIILKYFCIPFDIIDIGKYIYNGYSISFIIPMIYISVVMNIPEFILLISFIKHKIVFYLSIVLSSAIVGTCFYIFGNNGMINKISINYNDYLLELANALTINPTNFIRVISIIIYLVLVIYYLQKKGESKL